jgi:tRNA nucleotidyltransferase (CCA-adding enzyme)
MISADMAKEVLKRLKFDNKSMDLIFLLIKNHDRQIHANEKSVRKAVHFIGEAVFLDLLKIKEADIRAQNPKYLDMRINTLDQIKSIYFETKNCGACFSVRDLAINGNDLMDMGFNKGKDIGIFLEKLLHLVIETPELNTHELLIRKAIELKNNSIK